MDPATKEDTAEFNIAEEIAYLKGRRHELRASEKDHEIAEAELQSFLANSYQLVRNAQSHCDHIQAKLEDCNQAQADIKQELQEIEKKIDDLEERRSNDSIQITE